VTRLHKAIDVAIAEDRKRVTPSATENLPTGVAHAGAVGGALAWPRAEPDPRQIELATLADELTACREEVAAREKAAYDEGSKAGLAAGMRIGREQADQDEAVRIALIGKGVAAARETLAAKLTSLDAMAVAVAVAALERMLGSSAERASLVAEIVRHRLALLGRKAVLEVDISAADFHDEALLRASLPDGQYVTLRIDPDLPSGACLLHTEFEHMDAGIDSQLAALRKCIEVSND